jgi:LmbE family N-acetylglucosaminyl deacetylase
MITDPSQLGTVLGVWGHPDDEAYLSAGLMMGALAAGNRVVCLTATRGEAGFPEDDPRSVAARAAVREAELAACLSTLGVSEHHWLPYVDGACAEVDVDEAVTAIAEIVDAVQPDTVLTFGPDGGTWHPDHIATGRWTTLACRAAAPDADLYYATKTDDWVAGFVTADIIEQVMMAEGPLPPTTAPEDLAIWHVLDDERLERKVEALLAQESQILPLVEQTSLEWFRSINRDELFRRPEPDDWPS